MAGDDSRVELLETKGAPGIVAAWNLGLAKRGFDAVLLRNDLEASPGWMEKLSEVAYAAPRTACSFALTRLRSHRSCKAFGRR
jgi:hypothetical protein